ncbi:MAG: hypothetical protein H7069_07630 [Phormidesmis sp. FL-bin-119]|nr:hypothetical protein [Pedobacter sp.]
MNKKLIQRPEKLWSLNQMEISGEKPDIIGFGKGSTEYIEIVAR